jgi:hypothetical protein
LAGESLHPDGSVHQVDLEWRRGHRGGFVAPKCFWTLSFVIPDPRWIAANDREGMPLEKTDAAAKNRNNAVARQAPAHKEIL